MKKFWVILLLMCAGSLSAFAQKPNPSPNWEITFGRSWGRVHENSIKGTVSSDGRITSTNERNTTPTVGRISEDEIREISGLINRLNLPQAKAIPENQFNSCIVSPHLPHTYFSLTLNNKAYKLTHCNNQDYGNRQYEYTLNLSLKQKAIYKKLRAKLESLRAGERKPDGTSNSDSASKMAA